MLESRDPPASVVLMGGTDVTIAVGEAVMSAGIDIVAVVTVGEQFRISYAREAVRSSRHADVTGWAGRHGIPVFDHEDADAVSALLQAKQPRACLVAGWYHMIPRSFRDRFPLGCIGFHASLLPALRGGAPLNWAILNDMTETGVTLLRLGDGIDDGPIFGQERIAIGPRTCVGDLVAASRTTCAAMSGALLPDILAGRLQPSVQVGQPSYGLQRRPEHGQIDWQRPATEIDRLVRAVGRPYPGASTRLDEVEIRIWSTLPDNSQARISGAAGQLVPVSWLGADSGAEVAVITGAQILRVLEATDIVGADAMPLLRKSSQRQFSRV